MNEDGTSPAPRRLWTLDEYIVVADRFLRRGRSSGVHDSEVLALANLLGRTPASISRWLGNFAGTRTPGVGLKPVTGEAKTAFGRMEASPSARAEMVREACERLGSTGEPMGSPGSQWHLVPVERANTERFPRRIEESAREAERRESALVQRYRAWLDPDGTRLSGGLPRDPVTGWVWGQAAWVAGVVMMVSYSIGVNRPRAIWRRRRW